MPIAAMNMFEKKTFEGGALILLSSEITNPSQAEISQNYVFLKPMIQDSPSCVPSAYMLTDVFLYLDRLLNKQLFCKATKDEPREVQAGKEGVKAKKCIGALRTLWRSSTKSHDPRVAELKQMMTASPTRARRPAPDAPAAPAALRSCFKVYALFRESLMDFKIVGLAPWVLKCSRNSVEMPRKHPEAEDPAHDSGDEADHGHPDPDAADNALMDDSSSSAAEEVEEAGDASQGSGGGKGGEPSESYDSNSESENDEGEGDDCVADAQKAPVKDDSDSNAETLILGQGQSSPESVAATDGSSDSDSDRRDSQVSSGWMGKAINYYSRVEAKRKANLDATCTDLLKDSSFTSPKCTMILCSQWP